MSEQLHRQEPWSISEYGIIVDAKGNVIRVDFVNLDDNPRAANARRIVACINACEGIPTTTLELDGWLKEMNFRKRLAEVEIMRDELLSAAKLYTDAVEEAANPSSRAAFGQMQIGFQALRAAIAKSEAKK